MTQLVLNIESPTMVTGMQQALDDKAKGRVVTCSNKEELFAQLGI